MCSCESNRAVSWARATLAADAEESTEGSKGLRSPDGKRYSEVGTPHYLAPEILTGIGHSYPVDYWALGVMMYEFIYGENTPPPQRLLSARSGVPPFDGPDLGTIFFKITSCDVEWHDDVEISDECRDLITELLVVDPEGRLGSSSLEQLQQHRFFQGVEWDVLLTLHSLSGHCWGFRWFCSRTGCLYRSPTTWKMCRTSWGRTTKRVSVHCLLMARSLTGVACGSGVTDWSFDGLEGIGESPEGPGNLSDREGALTSQPDFLGFSFKNLSQLKDMNYAEIQQMENERLHDIQQDGVTFAGSLPKTPGGSKMRSNID